LLAQRQRVFLLRVEAAEQTVAFPVRSGGEIERVDGAAVATVPEPDAPESIDDDGPAVRRAHLIDKCSGHRIVGVDAAVAEVANP
jgi:hypothetical protein